MVGQSKLDFSSSVLDFLHLGLAMFLHSLACCEPAMPVFDLLHLGSPSPMRSFSRLGFSCSLLGLSRPGSVSLLSTISSALLEPLVLIRSVSRLGFALPVFDFLHIGSLFLLRSMAYFDLFMSASGLSRLDLVFLLLAIESTHSESFLPLRSCLHLGLGLLVLDFARADSLLLLRSRARVGSVVSTCGLLWCGSFMPLLDYIQCDLAVFLKSVSWVGSVMFVLDFLHLGLIISLRGPGHLGLVVLATGLSCLGFVSPLLVTESTNPGPFLSVHSIACSGLASSVPDFARMGLPLLPQGSGQVDSMPLVMGMSRMGLCSLILDVAQLGLPLFSHSLARSDSASFAFDFLHPGSPMLLQSSSRSGPTMLLFGLS